MHKKGKGYRRDMTVVLDRTDTVVFVDDIEVVKWYMRKHDSKDNPLRAEPAVFDPEKMAYVPDRGQFLKAKKAKNKFRRFK